MKRDVAIYSPFAGKFYESVAYASGSPAEGGGGAELQTFILAHELAERGASVAHITYPVREPAPALARGLTLVPRAAHTRRRGIAGKLGEAVRIWRALRAADARVYVFRTGLSSGGPRLLVGALFCRLRRRRLVLAASSDLDFVFEGRSAVAIAIYRVAVAQTWRIVVQTEQQLELAKAAVGRPERVARISSFAQAAETVALADRDPARFVWAGRIVDYKQPLSYIDLARAVPDAQFEMVAVRTGETPAELLAELHRRAAETPNLELHDALPRDRLMTMLERSAAAVLTSRYEGMPNLFLEAWSRGIPVVSLSFDPAGLVARRELGLHAGDDPARLADGIRRLIADPELGARWGGNGLAYVREEHSPRAVGDRWFELLELGPGVRRARARSR